MISLKNLILIELKIIKYLFYDMIPDVYNIKWFKHDFDSKLEYYIYKPLIFIIMLVISLLDTYVLVYRIVYLVNAMEGIWREVK